MPVLMGQLVGAFIAIFLFSMLFEWVLFKRVFDDAVKGKVGSALAALVLVEVVYALTSLGRPSYSFGVFSYLVAGIVFAIRGYMRGTDINIENQFGEADGPLDQTFS